jgi:hypothetical protein
LIRVGENAFEQRFEVAHHARYRHVVEEVCAVFEKDGRVFLFVPDAERQIEDGRFAVHLYFAHHQVCLLDD